MVHKWALRFLLEIFHGTVVGPIEFCSTFYMVKIWRCRILLHILHGLELGADEFFLTLYMESNWSLLSFSRHSSWYRTGRRPVLLDILHG